MSTPNSPVFVKYRGGNNAVDFSVPFPYFDKSYVKLIYKALNSDEVELVVNTDYIWKDDNTVTLNEPLGEYDVLVIVRRTDLGSPAEFDNQRRLFPVAAMDNDDLSFHQIQEMQEQLDRCYKEKITSDNDASDVESIISHYVNEAEAIKQDCMANADLARAWAIKMDGTIDGFNYSSKYYAMQIIPIKDDITTVASISSDVAAVASNSSNISAVASNETNINAVANNATNINAVNANKTNIDKVASDINRVNLVADDIASVHTVAVDISTVIDVANNATNINAVASNATNINAAVSNESNINAAVANESNINTVATNISNVNTTATNMSAINTTVANMTAIQNAPTYANNAYVWAEGNDADVQALGGTHSAKGWATTIGSVYKPAGSVAFASLPTLGSTYEGYVYNVTDAFTTTSDFVEGAGKSYPAGTNVVCIDTGSSVYKWDTLGGFVDLSGCANTNLSNLSATGEAKFDAKQDVISDLTTIRSGAALGATALQPNDNISELNNNVGYITGITSSDVTTALGYTPYNSSNPSGYITSSALTPYALSASLATVATSGSYNDLLNKPTIPTVNDATLTITQGGVSKGTFTANSPTDVTIALDAGGGSSLTAGVGIDITNDVISVDGVKDQRNTSTAIKTWTGTKAQYDAIVSKDANTLYNITDDASGTINVYNKAQVDTLLNNKADINLSNVSNNIDYIIETKLPSGNDTTWYRIYKSGWIEQGGRVSINCTANVTQAWSANFPEEMADTNYNYSLALKSGWIYDTLGGTEDYTTTFISGFIKTSHDQTVILTWEVKGQKA